MSSNYVPFPVWPTPAGEGGGVTVHNQLTGRSSTDAHPISAITGLEARLPIIVELGGTRAALDELGAVIADGVSVTIAALAPFVAPGNRLLAYSTDGTDAADGIYVHSADGVFQFSSDPFVMGNLTREVVVGTNFAVGGPSHFVLRTFNGVNVFPTSTSPPPPPPPPIPASIDDLGFDVATDIEAAVFDVTGDPYDVLAPLDDDLSGYLLWLALRDQNLTATATALGEQAEVIASTIGAQGQMDNLTGTPPDDEFTLAVGVAGKWLNVFPPEPSSIVLGATPSGSTTNWPNGTVIRFWHGNSVAVDFTSDGVSTIRSLGGLTSMGGMYAVVTAVWRVESQEWLLYGDLA